MSSSLLSKNIKIKIHRTIILPVSLYGCVTWSLILREERRLRLFENWILRRIFGPERDEVTGERGKLHNDELNGLYASPNIVRLVKSMSEMGEVCSTYRVYRVLVGKPKGMRPLWRSRSRWEDNIEMDVQEMGWWVWPGSSWLRMVAGGGHL